MAIDLSAAGLVRMAERYGKSYTPDPTKAEVLALIDALMGFLADEHALRLYRRGYPEKSEGEIREMLADLKRWDLVE